MDHERDDVISLQDSLTVLRRQRWIVLTTTVVVVVAALAVSFGRTPVYEGEAEIVVEPVRRTQDTSLEELLLPQNNMVATERVVVTSRPVAERAAEALDTSEVRGLLESVRVEAIADTRVVRVIASDTDPSMAAEKANAFADGYLDYRRDEAVDGLLAARSDLENRAAELREQVEELDADGEDDVDEIERDALLSRLSQITAQTAELGDAANAITGGGSVLSPAEPPEVPVSPRPVRTGALALVLGLMLGVGLAFLRDHVDDVIRDEDDFKRSTGDLPVLGRIPSWSDPEGGSRLATIIDPTSLAGESYRELSASVRFLLLAHAGPLPETHDETATPKGPAGRSILMTSAAAGDGKTSTAANLAVAAARVGLRTLLVDGDLRRPTVAARFGLGRGAGLSDLLLGGGRLFDHVTDVGIPDLLVLSAGTIPPNPNELLASPAMRALEHDIRNHVDLVIYDTPAVLAVPDALELGRHVDLAIVVGRASTTSRRQLTSAIERLQQVGTDVAGSVLNDINAKSDGYYYAYYYSEQPGLPTGRSSRAKQHEGKEGRRAGRRGLSRLRASVARSSTPAPSYQRGEPERWSSAMTPPSDSCTYGNSNMPHEPSGAEKDADEWGASEHVVQTGDRLFGQRDR